MTESTTFSPRGSRRAFLTATAAVAVASKTGASAAAAWPDHPVRLIVPFPPANSTDIIARVLADELSKRWPVRVIVDNRSGGAGAVGMEAGARAEPDGYTLTVGTSGTMAINPAIIDHLSYDPARDYAPITDLVTVPLVIVAHPSFEANTAAELLALAKSRHGEIDFATNGPGTAAHMSAELLAYQGKVKLNHVPYRGSGPALADVLSGNVKLMFDSLPSALQNVRAGRLKALAVTSKARAPQLPSVQTVAESTGLDYEAVGWIGLVGPAKLPPELARKINEDVVAILKDPGAVARMAEIGGSTHPLSTDQFGAFIQAEIRKWGSLARAANVHLEG